MTLAFRWPECFADPVQFPDPQSALNHAMALHRSGRTAEADALYRQLYATFPQAVDLIHLIGLTTFELGRRDEGIAMLQEALRHRPQVAHYHANYGAKLVELRRTAEAIAALERSIELEPGAAGHHYNLGNALFQGGRAEEAVASYRRALSLDPRHDLASLQLGMALQAAGRRDEGIAHYRAVLRERPADYAVATNLGALLQDKCDIDGAIEVFQQALLHEPNNYFALNNIAIMRKERGELAESLRLLLRCAELSPQSAEIRSNIILTMHYDPATTDAVLAAQHQEWNRRFGRVEARDARHPNPPEPARKLRLGYVSADFRDHVVGRALLPSLRRHDKAAFEVHCFANNPEQDFTAEFKAYADRWHNMAGASDQEFAETVRGAGIDILIDLGLHTSDNRLAVFARKPAPIQVSWLGYPESSGLDAMDYRISDRHLEPVGGHAVAGANEKAWTHPDCWTCFEPPAGYPDPNPSPCSSGQPFTFGCFNNTCKITDEVLAAWGRILLACPGARLRLLAKPGSHRTNLLERLERAGVEPGRVGFAEYLPASAQLSQGALLARYHEVDLALDTFPYNGMSTTLDALWMGVPVVTLVGRRNLGRAGLSLLSNVGLDDFAADGVEAYVARAVRAAGDRPGLAAWRAGLRARMRASPLLDAEGFTRKLERGFRDMWVDWCRRQPKLG